jgi:hypothetical protein
MEKEYEWVAYRVVRKESEWVGYGVVEMVCEGVDKIR